MIWTHFDLYWMVRRSHRSVAAGAQAGTAPAAHHHHLASAKGLVDGVEAGLEGLKARRFRRRRIG